MSRRPLSLGLILLLLVSPMLRAEQSPAVRAQVHVRVASPEQLRVLCAVVEGSGAAVRVVREGSQAVIEIAAAGPAELAQAVTALEQAAGAAGVKTSSLPTRSGEPGDALIVRVASALPAASKPLYPAQPVPMYIGTSTGAAAVVESRPTVFRTDDTPAPPEAPADSARRTRGPPA